jgi:site-specific DNA-methyltransferase (adenine-specific)
MELLANGRVTLHCGDSREKLSLIADNSIDSVVTDPPYALVSISKRFGKEGSAPAKAGTVYARSSRGFMGAKWDNGETAFASEFWEQVYRVLKPGGHMLAFSGTRTYHDMASAIAKAGFEIRDMIAWLYGTGFNKKGYIKNADGAHVMNGWGGALKPALEPICLTRKPLVGTVAENVLEHSTGALNIDGCRVEADDKTPFPVGANSCDGSIKTGLHNKPRTDDTNKNGRWPANCIHDGSPEVVEAFPETAASPPVGSMGGGSNKHSIYGDFAGKRHENGFGDSGSAARFFYTAKAGADDRLGSKHPTVKPLDLMQYLCRLVTPKNGTVLDPFAGTGTTGEAAFREGFNAVLIERETEYQADIRRRMSLVLGGQEERRYASIKAKGLVEDAGPLFGGLI